MSVGRGERDPMKTLNRSLMILAAAALMHTPLYAVESAPLHSIDAQTYNLTFAGTIRTPKGPCANADVLLEMQTSLNDNIKVMVKTQNDGTYSLKVAVKEFPKGQVDWKLTAMASGLSDDMVEEGRHIVAEDDTIHIDIPMLLASAPAAQVAL